MFAEAVESASAASGRGPADSPVGLEEASCTTVTVPPVSRLQARLTGIDRAGAAVETRQEGSTVAPTNKAPSDLSPAMAADDPTQPRTAAAAPRATARKGTVCRCDDASARVMLGLLGKSFLEPFNSRYRSSASGKFRPHRFGSDRFHALNVPRPRRFRCRNLLSAGRESPVFALNKPRLGEDERQVEQVRSCHPVANAAARYWLIRTAHSDAPKKPSRTNFRERRDANQRGAIHGGAPQETRGFENLICAKWSGRRDSNQRGAIHGGAPPKTRGFEELRREEMERAKGFEPSTPTLARLCSTPELRPL